MMNHQEILIAFKALQQQRKKYSYFHAAELHIHTPASSDYKLKQDKLLKDATLEDVIALAIEYKLISSEQKELIKDLEEKNKNNIIYELIRFQKELLSRTNNLAFIKDGDSHSVEEIGINIIWIKCGSVNFTNLRHAFDDKPTRIALEKPKPNINTIIGMCVLNGKKGFLGNKNKNQNYLLIPYSSDLNTIIGGKGTGKTTLLNLLEWAFSQQCKNKKEFDFLLQFDEIHVFICTKDKHYVISIKPAKIWDEYSLAWDPDFHVISRNAIRTDNNISIRGWVSVRKISRTSIGGYLLKLVPKEKEAIVINSIYKRIYSLSSIIHTVENENFSGFIKNVLNTNSAYLDENIKTILSKSTVLNNRDLEHNLMELSNLIEKRIIIDDIIIDKLNKQSALKLILKRKVKHEHLGHVITERIPKIVGFDGDYKVFLIDIFFDLISKIDFIILVKWFLSNKMQSIIDLVDWVLTPDKGQKHIEKEINLSPHLAITNLRKILLDNLIYDCLEAYIQDKSGDFDLEFNINYKEGDQGTNFKDITELSQGQKGIAILTFIFEISTLISDDTPLILDQPEDHLDNLYIYKSLITDLRKIKNKKQVIVVTHNPSIVMAGDAEQVLAMGSNGRVGWLEKQGSSDTESIVKFILGLMEGGRDCLELRLKKYNYKFSNLSNEFV